MMDYDKQYVLVPPTEKPQGKNRRKLPRKQSAARKQRLYKRMLLVWYVIMLGMSRLG